MTISTAAVRRKPLELFRHAAPELQDTLNALGILGISLGIKQQRGFYPGKDFIRGPSLQSELNRRIEE